MEHFMPGFVREIEGGIYIDWNCIKVQKLEKGIFLPTIRGTKADQELFDVALAAFLKEWHTSTDGSLISG